MDAILNGLAHDQVFRYTAVATICLVSYEYLIMLDNEIRNLWGQRFTFGGALLFLCRYLPFTSVLQVYVYISASDSDFSNCLASFRVCTSLIYVNFLLTIFVLFTRAYAVWGGSKKVLYLLVVTYAGGVAGSAYSIYRYLTGVSIVAIRDVKGCLPHIANDDVWISLTVFISLESLVLGLLLLKSVKHAKAVKNLNRHESKRNILSVMVQDGIGYFACTLAITTLNLVLLKRVTPDLRDILISTQGALQNILCSRLLLHVRSVRDSASTSTIESRISSSVSAPMSVNVSRTTEYY